MGQFAAITGRNLKLYFRDRAAVFLSLLSMFIVIALMVFFLGDLNVESITEVLEQFKGRDAARDKENAKLLVLSWTCAGILSINAVTVTLSAYSVMIKDKTSGKLNAIYSAPVSRMAITAGYSAAAWVASVCVCLFTLFIIEIYSMTQGLAPFCAVTHLKLFGMIFINSFVYVSFMYLLAAFIKTESAWSAIGTIVGTLVGFLGGIYVPVGTLAQVVVRIMKCTPVLYGTAMFRDVMTEDILHTTFLDIPDPVIAKYREAMGIDLSLFGKQISFAQELLLLLFCGMILLVISAVVLACRKKTDR